MCPDLLLGADSFGKVPTFIWDITPGELTGVSLIEETGNMNAHLIEKK